MNLREDLIEKIKNADVIEVNPHIGLSEEQVEFQRKEGFSNKTKKSVTKTYWQIFYDNVFTFFNIVYFVIVILMLAAGMDFTNYMFLFPVIFNICIGLFTDIHTRHLVSKLRLVTDPKATVIREGKEISIPVNEVVLNDVMLVSAGEQICADSIVLEGNIEMDESLLTGESIKVRKNPGDKILSATYVKSGKAYVRVSSIGVANYCESIQASAKTFKRPKSELKSSCLKIFISTGVVSMTLGIITTISWVIRSAATNDLNYEAFKRFIPSLSGSMIAMIPAGLYLLVSLALAVSVGRLAQKKMNVQELYCVEMLAKVDTICFDKTGTITDGSLSLYATDVYGEFNKEELEMSLCSIIKKNGDANQTAKCLLSSFKESSKEPNKTIAFDSEKKYAVGYFEDAGLFVYGAPEFIPGEMNEEQHKRLKELTAKGFRVLGVFHSKKDVEGESLPNDLKLVSIISLSDHIKDDAKANIEWFVENGVQVKVISGDNADTVSYIAKEAGVPNADKCISMENVKDEDIPNIVEEYAVFGRVKPEQKANIIAALQEKDHKVAMTGDGVNDILALKKADCSIAMGSGSSAARNVSHIVSADNDFSKLPDVVAEGRRAINNLQRSASLFLAKTIFAVTLTFFFFVVSSFGGPNYPFTTKNLYIWEIVTIGGGGFFLALQKTNDRINGSFMSNVLRRAVPGGFVQIVAVIIFYSIHMANPEFVNGDQALLMSVISFSVLSYCVLGKVSWKFDKYRGGIFAFLLVSGVALFTLDYFFGEKIFDMFLKNKVDANSPKSVFGLTYNCLTPTQIWIVAGVTLLLIIVYFTLNYIDNHYFMKKRRSV